MADTMDDRGREDHELRMELGEAAGMIFRADALGCQWGKTRPFARF
jgi:hypothetical protein